MFKTILFALMIIIIALVIITLAVLKVIVYPAIKQVGKGSTEIAFVGDSITYGWGVLPNRNRAFASLVPGMLGKDYYSVNYGLGGRTLQDETSMPYYKEKSARKFQTSRPDIVVFMLGTNDTPINNWDYDRFKREYRERIEQILAMPTVKKTYIMIPPVIYMVPKNDKQDNGNMLTEKVIPTIKEAIEGLEVEVIDLYKFTDGHKEWFNDGLHPNVEGNCEIARYIACVIKETL